MRRFYAGIAAAICVIGSSTAGVFFAGRLHAQEAPALIFEKKSPELTKVSTWKELLKTPLLTATNCDVHVGIEATTCPANSAVLVYCHVVREQQVDGESAIEGEKLGPLQFTVRSLEPEANKHKKIEELRKAVDQMKDSFFAAAAKVGGPGKYEVRITASDGTMVAKTIIEATKDEGAEFFALERTENPADANVGVYRSTSDTRVPKWEGYSPMAMVETLPKYLPDTPDPAFDVSIKDQVVTAKSKGFLDHDVEEKWLIRWFVNGKSATSVRKEMRAVHKRTLKELRGTKEVSFKLEFDATPFDIKAGDKLEFQLLYSCDGTEAGAGKADIKMIEMEDSAGCPVRLSKKLPYPNPKDAAK